MDGGRERLLETDQFDRVDSDPPATNGLIDVDSDRVRLERRRLHSVHMSVSFSDSDI